MNVLQQMLLFLFSAAIIQNMVLTMGFGSSIMLRIVRRPGDIWIFGGILTGFSLLTVWSAYPLDKLIGSSIPSKLLRPLMLIALASVFYVVVSVFLKRLFPAVYHRIGRLLPLAAFNNLVIGLALLINHEKAYTFLNATAFAVGSCVGFVLLTWLTAEGMERLDNPELPAAFRGLPATLLYLGILALALLGFSNSITL